MIINFNDYVKVILKTSSSRDVVVNEEQATKIGKAFEKTVASLSKSGCQVSLRNFTIIPGLRVKDF